MSLCSGTSYALCRAKGFRRRLQPHRCAYVPTEGKGRGGAPMRIESEELSVETASTDACASGSLDSRSLGGSKLAGENCTSPKKSHQLCLLPVRLHDGCRQQTDRGNVERRCQEIDNHDSVVVNFASRVTRDMYRLIRVTIAGHNRRFILLQFFAARCLPLDVHVKTSRNKTI